MLHKDILISLCQARDTLREPETCGVPIPRVAHDIGMSPYHFIRLFKAVFGETPKQVQLQARLESAKLLLMLTDRSVTRVCLDVGFGSLGTFSHVFKRRVGMTPSAYRRMVRPMVQVPGEIPRQLVPGCFSLMGGPVDEVRNF